MGVDLDVALANNLGRQADELRRALAEAAIPAVRLAKNQDRPVIEAEFPDTESLAAARALLAKQFANLALNADGLRAELTLSETEAAYLREMTGRQALETIRNRVDLFGVAEPDIRPQGDGRIVIQLPGLSDPQRAVALIGKTAMLEFKLMNDTRTAEWALKNGVPAGEEILYGREGPEGRAAPGEERAYLLRRQPLMTGEGLVDARVVSSQYAQPEVSLTFDARGARQFERITGEYVKRRLAIVLDGAVYSAPTIQDRISGGRAVINGIGNYDEARDLAVALRAGALPAPVSVLEERTVGPTLGEDSIRLGLKAGALGLGLILIFMALYYHRAGLVADAALVFNFPIILGALAALGATLTLPGIFGLVLTMGMAVDANVLIFERIREELRAGKTPRAAVAAGFDRAFWTIFDSNLTSILAALILYQFGTGPIRGFAVTLTIGLLSSMFTAIFFSRLVFDLGLSRPGRRTISLGRLEIVKPGVNLNFIGRRFIFLPLAALLVLASLVSISTRGLELGLDFAGGALVQARFAEPAATDEIRAVLGRAGLGDARIQTYGAPGDHEFLINLRGEAEETRIEEGRTTFGAKAGQALVDHFGADRAEIRRVEMVGPQVGRDLRGKAFSALFYSLLMIIIYISGRFEQKWGTSAVFVGSLLGVCYLASLLGADLAVMTILALLVTLALCYFLKFQYALGAILALVHDIVVTVGVFSFLGKEISLSFVAAILTIVGFSINDTIIIFDRIREHISRSRRLDYGATINRSLNETLSRTVLTSGTTVLATLALYIFGGQANQDFALALIIGFTAGTFSSIMVAAPVLLFWPQPRGGEENKKTAPAKAVPAR